MAVKEAVSFVLQNFMLNKDAVHRNYLSRTFGVNKVISTIVDKANLPKISPHGLRHTHAIMMLEIGNDIKIVSDRLGHSSLNITTDVYLHITKKHEKESILRLESCLKD